MDWKQITDSWVLIPPKPIGIVHFLGGAFVATAPHLTYRWLLEQLANQGYIIVATPFVNTFDHRAIAQQVLLQFERVLIRLEDRGILGNGYYPIYGVGHSMGCKLHLLIGSLFPIKRAGNILISFNNFAARDAVPFLEQFNTSFAKSPFAVEFSPSPAQTNDLIREDYGVRRNLLIKFSNDTIDQSTNLHEILETRFPGMVATQILTGTHVTPLGQDFKLQSNSSFSPLDALGQWFGQNKGDFTPFDALGQWFQQEAYRDLNQLKAVILRWLNPLLN
ncbi:DUF1350 family protein [Calothrix sp. PCC 6303]|uniref:DUF1350 family protein n=1 Tax=Calothrix sp. PCC 6303 TaxID=1170562 RepID=UPI0002A02D65|nr:DUF1350 family protein [Calothrix sp. PCC 6303]AFZ00201.1 protein of unknown function DUF1350 [Calothrix sp. PCC 6303]